MHIWQDRYCSMISKTYTAVPDGFYFRSHICKVWVFSISNRFHILIAVGMGSLISFSCWLNCSLLIVFLWRKISNFQFNLVKYISSQHSYEKARQNPTLVSSHLSSSHAWVSEISWHSVYLLSPCPCQCTKFVVFLKKTIKDKLSSMYTLYTDLQV